jgi:Mn-dependent DtxR family transcriptional regulator
MTIQMSDSFTEKQGQYLAFIYNYTIMNGCSPAEYDLERFFRTTPPTVHQMILKLEEKGLISRVLGQARSIRLLVDPEEIPRLKKPKDPEGRTRQKRGPGC